MKWYISALGNAQGRIMAGEKEYRLQPFRHGHKASFDENRQIIMDSTKGKLADSEDSFVFAGFRIDPRNQNFCLSALLEYTDPAETDNQTGFGIIAVDTLGAAASKARHRNHLLLGSFRTADGNHHGFGVRAVSGYRDVKAIKGSSARVLDNTRIGRIRQNSDAGKVIEDVRHCVFLQLEKNDSGFLCGIISSKDRFSAEDNFSIPGCSFLTQQDASALWIGFAVGGCTKIKISEIHCHITPGMASVTPENTFRHIIPEYPFLSRLLADCPVSIASCSRNVRGRRTLNIGTIYISPDGTSDGDGSEKSPVDIVTALSFAREGDELVLLDGIYRPKEPIYIPSELSGKNDSPIRLRALNRRRAVFEGTEIHSVIPLVILQGCFWHMEGIVFRRSKSNGLFICGSCNDIVDCEAYENEDSGFLICSFPGNDNHNPPSDNHIRYCDSHHNRDKSECNADGFGCKLSAGAGNTFYQCTAYNNIDDGFDFYTKSTLGSIGAVIVDECVACHNSGIGFKLGGENQCVSHELWNCISYSNGAGGFSANSNPDCRIHFCTSWNNYDGRKLKNYRFYGTKPMGRKRMECCLPVGSPAIDLLPFFERLMQLLCRKAFIHTNSTDLPSRAGDLTIQMKGFLTRRKHNKRRLGAEISAKRNILFLIPKIGGGGGERVTAHLASELSKKHNVYLMYFYHYEGGYEIAPDVTLIDCSRKDLQEQERWRAIHNLIRAWQCIDAVYEARRRYGIDVTVSMLRNSNLYNILSPGQCRRILSERNDPSKVARSQYMPNRLCYYLGDYVVFQTEYVQAMFSRIIRRKSTVIMNPVSVACRGNASRNKRVVNVGRLTEQKNQALLIRAFSVFHETHPDYSLQIYGEGKLRDSLQSLINQLGLSEYVKLEGYHEDLHTRMCNSEIFVLSSDYEGLSNVLAEAMMLGIPCISTDCAGSHELINDGIDGVIVPIGDRDSLVKAMCRLADDASLWKMISNNCRSRASEWDINRIAKQWERIL